MSTKSLSSAVFPEPTEMLVTFNSVTFKITEVTGNCEGVFGVTSKHLLGKKITRYLTNDSAKRTIEAVHQSSIKKQDFLILQVVNTQGDSVDVNWTRVDMILRPSITETVDGASYPKSTVAAFLVHARFRLIEYEIEAHLLTARQNTKHDLHIPKHEIKCKCPNAESLFTCQTCFNKESQLCLGVGSYAVAFYSLWMGTPVAVKAFIKKKESSRSDKRQRRIEETFRRELAVLKSLRHPNIIGLYGYDSEHLYLVMEVARNGCLADKIRFNKNREFSNTVWPIHLKIALELVSGLRFLHERGFIHGDLKSFNILLDSNYTVKIADFGTAGSEADKPSDSPLSIAWAAPERLLGGEISCGADIYAVGIILWELATLLLPYNDFNGSPQKLASQILHAKLRPEVQAHLDGLLSGYRLPPLYVWLMQKTWQTKPKNRMTLNEMYRILIEVKNSWKCARCGWFNHKEETVCAGCEFDPFSADQLDRLLSKTDVELESMIQKEVDASHSEAVLTADKYSVPKRNRDFQDSRNTTDTATSSTELDKGANFTEKARKRLQDLQNDKTLSIENIDSAENQLNAIAESNSLAGEDTKEVASSVRNLKSQILDSATTIDRSNAVEERISTSEFLNNIDTIDLQRIADHEGTVDSSLYSSRSSVDTDSGNLLKSRKSKKSVKFQDFKQGSASGSRGNDGFLGSARFQDSSIVVPDAKTSLLSGLSAMTDRILDSPLCDIVSNSRFSADFSKNGQYPSARQLSVMNIELDPDAPPNIQKDISENERNRKVYKLNPTSFRGSISQTKRDLDASAVRKTPSLSSLNRVSSVSSSSNTNSLRGSVSDDDIIDRVYVSTTPSSHQLGLINKQRGAPVRRRPVLASNAHTTYESLHDTTQSVLYNRLYPEKKHDTNLAHFKINTNNDNIKCCGKIKTDENCCMETNAGQTANVKAPDAIKCSSFSSNVTSGTNSSGGSLTSLTKNNTGYNKQFSDVVLLPEQMRQEQSAEYDYSQYTKSCIVKECGKCTFKDNCVLNLHKHLHNQDVESNKSVLTDSEESNTIVVGADNINEIMDTGDAIKDFYKSTGSLAKGIVYNTEELDNSGGWECDLCFSFNKSECTECSHCHAVKE